MKLIVATKGAVTISIQNFGQIWPFSWPYFENSEVSEGIAQKLPKEKDMKFCVKNHFWFGLLQLALVFFN